ncbi:Serine carboxypeptidase-like 31 [Linum perenne]
MTPLLPSIIIVALLYLIPVSSARQGEWSIQKRLNTLVNDHLVTNLPGQPDVTFKHYSGFLPVNETSGRALFYWFYEATNQSDEKPLVLWLNGGPGCSSVGYGATQEIGPFIVDANGHGIKYNPFSWNREANMLFLESPVGVGFSYSNTSTDYNILGDEFTANDAYAFLHKWFLKFPSYRTRTFYIAGESYAGKYIPELAEFILDRNSDPSLHIDLKGILMGNPETNDADDWRGMVDYAWSHAVISDETHRIISQSCNFSSDDTWSNNDCSDSVDELLRQYKEIDIYSLYTSVCVGDSASSDEKSTQVMFKRGSKMMPRIMGGYDPCLDDYAKAFYNRADVQKALHVSDGHRLRNWSICNEKIFNEWKYTKPSVLPIYTKLIAAGIRIWVYSGDTDGRVPVLSTRYSISAMGLKITKSWRPWYHQRQVSGWFQEYQGLTFATFRGAGHAVPVFKPSETLAFFSAFLLGQAPPSARSD